MKRLLAVLMVELCSTYLVNAAIVTERNDVYATPPNYAKFGRNSNGIASQWIPYGTYTGGNGGTEYLRVTSNLVGVVASIFDGLEERALVPYGLYVPDRFLLPMSHVPWRSHDDHGEFIESATNQTLRIADLLNANSVIRYSVSDGTNYHYYVDNSGTVEERLATSYMYGPDGVSTWFGGRLLDQVTGNFQPPPAGDGWAEYYPYDLGIFRWENVFPTFRCCGFDDHFFTTNGISSVYYPRDHLRDWMFGQSEYWDGDDISYELYLFFDGLESTPLSDPRTDRDIKIEDVLKIDPGFSTVVEYQEWDFNGHVLEKWYDSPPRWGCEWYAGDDDEGFPILDDIVLSYADGKWTAELDENYHLSSQTVPGSWGDSYLNFDSLTYAGKPVYLTSTPTGDDFAHWRNGTTRLDWKRLGIICQLERQMEKTYKARGSEQDELGFEHQSGVHEKSWKSDTGAISFTVENVQIDNIIRVSAWTISDLDWNLKTNDLSVTTNSLGWSFPSVRSSRPYFSGAMRGGGPSTTQFAMSKSAFWNEVPPGGSYRAETTIIGPGFSPSGSLTIRLDGTMGTMTSWVVPDGVYELTNAPVYKSMVKHTDIRLSTTATNLHQSSAFPSPQAWNDGFVSRVRIPTFEVMLSVTNDDSFIDADVLTWRDLLESASNKSERVFRSADIQSSASFDSLQANRSSSLRSLSSEVFTKYAELTGIPASSFLSAAATISSTDETYFDRYLKTNETAGVVVDMAVDYVLADPQTQIVTGYKRRPGGGVDEVAVPEEDGNYVFGRLLFSFESLSGGPATNFPPCRVDGRQSQLVETLWKFKNLRDPNL